MCLSIKNIPSKKEQPVREGPIFTTYSILESLCKLFLPHFICLLLEIKKHSQENLNICQYYLSQHIIKVVTLAVYPKIDSNDLWPSGLCFTKGCPDRGYHVKKLIFYCICQFLLIK